MTYEEAFNLLIRKTCRCSDESEQACALCSSAYDIVETLILTAEKYEWHDLRKNPNDVPMKPDLYLVKRVVSDRFCPSEYAVIVFEREFWNEQRVIAWREIEKFEVME